MTGSKILKELLLELSKNWDNLTKPRQVLFKKLLK